MLPIVFYVLVCITYVCSLFYNINNITHGGNHRDFLFNSSIVHNFFTYGGFGGKLKYLTFWNLVR